jgi:hypothetical protein
MLPILCFEELSYFPREFMSTTTVSLVLSIRHCTPPRYEIPDLIPFPRLPRAIPAPPVLKRAEKASDGNGKLFQDLSTAVKHKIKEFGPCSKYSN